MLLFKALILRFFILGFLWQILWKLSVRGLWVLFFNSFIFIFADFMLFRVPLCYIFNLVLGLPKCSLVAICRDRLGLFSWFFKKFILSISVFRFYCTQTLKITLNIVDQLVFIFRYVLWFFSSLGFLFRYFVFYWFFPLSMIIIWRYWDKLAYLLMTFLWILSF